MDFHLFRNDHFKVQKLLISHLEFLIWCNGFHLLGFSV